jgi:molecular chaperone GrpE
VKHQDTTKIANDDQPRTDAESEATVESDATQDSESTATEAQVSPPAQSATEAQAKEYLEGWQRERSEFANYKRRVERDMKDISANAAAQAFMSLLPIIDDFERAFSSVPSELQGNAWMEGIAGIQRKFAKILEDQGLTVIDPVGEAFDPTRHEAVGTEDSETVPSGHVTTTLQKGYVRGERVLRPALVRVAT